MSMNFEANLKKSIIIDMMLIKILFYRLFDCYGKFYKMARDSIKMLFMQANGLSRLP
jgi:hypothetical protein